MKINPYLAFNGSCSEAFPFYQRILGGEIMSMITYRDSPMAETTPADQLDRILHATLSTDGNVLMGGDAPPQRFTQPSGFSVSVSIDTAEEAERIFSGLAEGGQVHMPIGETFWAVRFGMLIDKYGIPWMINCEKTPA
ncbi:MAG: VOC family protein [Capsulimonadaceae bacterium]